MSKVDNADMPEGIKFDNDEGGSIVFEVNVGEVLVTIEDFGTYVDCPTYFSLTKSDLTQLVPKLKALLAQLNGESDE